MNHRNSIVAGSILVVCLSPLGAATASARLPEERAVPDAIAPHDPPVRDYACSGYEPLDEPAAAGASTAGNSSDDYAVVALQAGVSALAGAGLALGGVQLYQRRQRRAN